MAMLVAGATTRPISILSECYVCLDHEQSERSATGSASLMPELKSIFKRPTTSAIYSERTLTSNSLDQRSAAYLSVYQVTIIR